MEFDPQILWTEPGKDLIYYNGTIKCNILFKFCPTM